MKRLENYTLVNENIAKCKVIVDVCRRLWIVTLLIRMRNVFLYIFLHKILQVRFGKIKQKFTVGSRHVKNEF